MVQKKFKVYGTVKGNSEEEHRLISPLESKKVSHMNM